MMKWSRGEFIGRGSSGTVNLVKHNHNRPLIAVKSAILSQSSSLQNEMKIMTLLRGCPQILGCFANEITIENGEEFYNLFLEYAPGGTLANLLKKSGGSVPESDVQCHTRSILQGLRFIHGKGYVHCDIKLENILVCGSKEVIKIADFGLAKVVGGEKEERVLLRGTPLYMSPESVTRNEHGAPSDIWSLGCIVAQLVTGKPPWKVPDVNALLCRVGFGDEVPEIPQELSEQGRDFLSRCLVKDPTKRWTAEMLLNHPFVKVDDKLINDERVLFNDDKIPMLSPTSAFEFPSLNSSQFSLPSFSLTYLSPNSPMNSVSDRIRRLETSPRLDWISSDSWLTVRQVITDGVMCLNPLMSSSLSLELDYYKPSDHPSSSITHVSDITHYTQSSPTHVSDSITHVSDTTHYTQSSTTHVSDTTQYIQSSSISDSRTTEQELPMCQRRSRTDRSLVEKFEKTCRFRALFELISSDQFFALCFC